MSTTISTTTTTSVTVSGAALRDAFATLARVGKTRAATIHDAGDGGIIISVRVTPREESHGSVSVYVPATIEHGDDPLPFVLAAGVLTLPISDGPVTIAATATGFTVDGNPVASGFTVSESHHSLLAPTIPNGTFRRVIPCDAFSDMVPRIAGISSKDKTRPVLTGALIEYREGPTVTIAGTDSYRLHVGTTTTTFPTILPDGDYIVPAPFLMRVAKEAKRRGYGPNVILMHAEGWTVANVGPVTIAARDITGQYPDHRQLVPAEWETTLTGDTAAWRDALADIMARGKAAGMDPRLIMEGTGDGTVSLLMEGNVHHSIVEVHGSVPAMGDGFARMGINATYMADCISAMPGDTFTLGVISPLRPVLMRSGDVTTLLMPIRLPA